MVVMLATWIGNGAKVVAVLIVLRLAYEFATRRDKRDVWPGDFD